MRGRPKSAELEELNSGLAAAEDPYMFKDLLARPLEENVDEVNRQIRYSAISMLRAGQLFMVIKHQVRAAKASWETFVDEQHWSWEYVRCSMKFIEVVALFPQAMNLPGGRVVHKMLHLPAPQLEEIFTDLPPEAIEKLTPWDIEK